MTSSPITDFLIRLKNASKAGKTEIIAPASKVKTAICELLKKHHFITDYQTQGDVKKNLLISFESGNISSVSIFSKPSRHVYHKVSSLPWGKTRRSLIIVSTSSGLMSQKQARSQNLGGEILAEIY